MGIADSSPISSPSVQPIGSFRELPPTANSCSRFLALRFFSVWGPSQRRDLTHVEDVARAVEMALHWPGPGSAVLNVGTGKNRSVMDMLDAAQKTAAALHFSGSSFTFFTPPVLHQNAHPPDVPETRASLMAVGKELDWAPWIFFPKTGDSDAEKV